MVVNGIGIDHFDQQEIGIAVIHLQHTRHFGQFGGKPLALAAHLGHMGIVWLGMQALGHFGLGGCIYVVGIFYAGKDVGYHGTGKGQSKTQAGHAPRL